MARKPRAGFLVFHDSEPLVRQLSKEQAGELLFLMFDYSNGKPAQPSDQFVGMAFAHMAMIIDRNRVSYEAKCEQSSIASQIRWEKDRQKKALLVV